MPSRTFRRSKSIRSSRRMRSFESLEKRELLTFIAQIGGTQNVYMPDGGVHAVDDEGNTYIGGRFQGTADFDPGPDTYALSSEEDTAFVASYDPQGALRWVREFEFEGVTSGGNNPTPFAMTTGLALGNDGSVHATGRFSGSIDLMGDGTFVATQGDSDAFIVKLDSENGAIGWAKTIGGSNSDRGDKIAVGGDGSVFVGGDFTGTVDFDPGNGTHNLTSVAQRKNTSSRDGFILKLDVSGNYETAWSFGGSGTELVHDFVLDGDAIFVAGRFEGTADFGPGGSSGDRTSAGNGAYGLYFASYATNGQLNWVQSIGNDNIQGTWVRLAVDDTALFVTSDHWGSGLTLDIDPSESVYNVTGTGSIWSFAAKYSRDSGILLDDEFTPAVIEGVDGDGRVRPRGAAILDSAGALYVGMSYYGGPVDIDPGPGIVSPPFDATCECSVVLKLDATGSYDAHWYSGGYTVSPVRVLDNSLYMVGNFNDPATFPTGDTLISSASDIYLLGLTLSEPSEPPTPVAGGPYAGVEDTPVTFDASGASDPDGDPLTYHWDFGDGNTETTNSPSISHPFAGSGDYTITLTVSDGVSDSSPVVTTVSIADPPAGDPNVIYVSDISFESKPRGSNTDWRVVVTVRRDSNADGFGTSSDAVVANAQVTVTFNGQTFTGQTDSNGIFRTSYVRNLGSGNHVAEVTDAVFGSYEWDPLMVVDLDGDGIPDDDLDSDDADVYPEAVLTL